MASFLYRLGRFAFRRRWLVTAVWVAVLAAALAGAATLSESTSDTFRIPGTPSQQAIDLLNERFPQASADGATARVVFAASDGQQLSAVRAEVEQAIAQLKEVPQVASVSDPFQSGAVNAAGTVAFASATYQVPSADLTDQARDALTAVVDEARAQGLTVEVGGDAVRVKPEQGAGEVVGIAVAAVVLFITFGSLVAAGLPLLTAILGIAIGIGAISTMSGFVNLSSTTPTLALMIGLAVGIDYALFIVSRYRHELAAGRDREEAAGLAVGTAGSAVVFAGLTVVIALAALVVAGIPFITQMGLAAAFTVAVAVVIALTLLPALLGFAGRRISRKPRGLHARDLEADRATPGPNIGARRAGAIARRPVVALLIGVITLGVIAIPALDLRLGMPDDGAAAPDTTQRKAYDLLAGAFGPGFNAPLTVTVDAGAGSAQAAADQVTQAIHGLRDVATVTPAVINPAGDTALLTVIPTSEPSAAATEELVHSIREIDGTVPGASIGVTGLTAINIDVSKKLGDALVPYLIVVVGLAFVLLLLVFRSLLVPVTATLGFLLSIAATFGAVVTVFQWGWLADVFGIKQTGPIISLLPIILVGIVFGLAMDYQVFLVTRMREEYSHGSTPRQAMITGFGHGARVVTAAAFIMISVFSGFILSPESIVKSIGFALGVAVLFDAVVVRMTIIPAVMALLGRAAWWLPRWLDRILPNLDVEGEKLRHLLDDGPDPLDTTHEHAPA
ncbi:MULTISPECIES: MMPL family transporter [unclassified Parafrankia]|uniref:MMPL family transporter n=1 Tax=Parafrankia TaxID=2994362 RepID=UPI000DA4789E|nr:MULTISPECIES: MMPL family transporter [unclassified Parafrankia]TCJ32095.1 MMPL family transporter [Parafrankia sp. BMG5.11]CAI7974877.1 Membrane protein YdfJ [Frankia sp. Hr75.2]SQD97060.1 Membrane protein YdfJ [Parafrankia sp. Ea1.12]